MSKQPKSPNFFDDGNGKDKHFEAQMKRVFKSFSEKPKTMLMVEVETGIMRPSICRYVGKWKRQNRIQIVEIGICPISKHGGVQFLSPMVEPQKAVNP